MLDTFRKPLFVFAHRLLREKFGSFTGERIWCSWLLLITTEQTTDEMKNRTTSLSQRIT